MQRWALEASELLVWRSMLPGEDLLPQLDHRLSISSPPAESALSHRSLLVAHRVRPPCTRIPAGPLSAPGGASLS
jgi:hypothetical protein